jgi:putative ABC transport system permease protein
MIEELLRDLRFGARSLARTPVVTIAALLSIALGIAATTSVFGVVDAALFRPPPFEQPGQLAALYVTRQEANAPVGRERWSYARYRLLRDLNTSFEEVATFTLSVLAITSDEAEPVNAEVVSSAYLSLLRIQPVAGRAFTAEDDDAAAPPVAMIGYDLWQRRYGGERSVLGRTVSLNGVAVPIVGILPRGFVGLTGRGQVWVSPTQPSRATYRDYLTTNQNFISVVGRLKPSVSIDRARSELATLGREIQRLQPSVGYPGTRFAATAMTLNEARVDPSTRTPMLLLLAAVTCLLALSCANVAGLLLGRAVSRRREIAIRIATGAGRARIVKQLLVESALLALAGGAIGVLVAIPVTANAGIPSAMWRGRNFYGALSEFSTARIDGRVLFVAIAVCVLTTLVFGLVPSLQATRLDLTSALKDGIGTSPARGRRLDPRRVIVGVETGLAMVLLVAGGLLAASWRRLATADVGFDRSHLLTFLIRPSEVKYPPPKAADLYVSLLGEIERLPGVVAASVDGCAPVGTGCASSTLYVMGRPLPAPGEAPGVLRHYVGPNHFHTLSVAVIRGRTFDARDRAGAPRVAIINQVAARRFWPDEDPIGKRVWFGGGSTFDRPDSSAEIIGIVGDVAYQALDERPFQSDFYTPYAQFTYATRTVLVRTRGEPAAMLPDIRAAIARVDPGLALFEIRTMDDKIGDSWARLSYQTKILSVFAIIALLLAATGIFAIVAHVINDRRREIGIRVALGATPVQVLTAVGESGARPAAVGLVLGAAGAVVAGRLLTAAVYGVRAFDPLVIGAVVFVLAIVIVAAAYFAARRALLVDPVESLRFE